MYKEVSPSKWPIIWYSLYIKSWSTYSEVFLLFWYLVHKKILKVRLNFSNLSCNSNMMNYNKITLNLFLFRIINILHIIKSTKHIKHIQRRMIISIHMFLLFFPNSSLDLGKISFTTRTKPVLDMTRKLPLTFHITPIQSSFRALESSMKVHLHLLQFKFQNSNIMIVLAILIL